MEEAAVHAVDGLAADTPLLAVVVIGVVLIVATVMIVREIRAGQEKRLESETEQAQKRIEAEREATKERLQLEREESQRRLEIEERRESRKQEEMESRIADQAEVKSLLAQSIDATNRSTAAIEGMQRVLELQNTRIEMSQERSHDMGEQLKDIHETIHAVDNNLQDLVDDMRRR